MAEAEKGKGRVVMIAMDGSQFADYAFDCKYTFILNTVILNIIHIIHGAMQMYLMALI